MRHENDVHDNSPLTTQHDDRALVREAKDLELDDRQPVVLRLAGGVQRGAQQKDEYAGPTHIPTFELRPRILLLHFLRTVIKDIALEASWSVVYFDFTDDDVQSLDGKSKNSGPRR